MQSRHGRQPNFPPGFTQHHEDLIHLFYIVNPEQNLTELFDNIKLNEGGEAFPMLAIRNYSNDRRQTHKRRKTPIHKVFTEKNFYPHFEDSHIINQLLVLAS